MGKRFVSIWFRYLTTDWFTRHQPNLMEKPFVLAAPDHGRMIVTAANMLATTQDLYTGMAVADARAVIPGLVVMDDQPGLPGKLLQQLAEYCIRYSPVVALDPPDGLILDATGCSHLWNGEEPYLKNFIARLKSLGFTVRAAMADTIGTAWAVARFGNDKFIIKPGNQLQALINIPPAAIRIEPQTEERLHKLGLRYIRAFICMPRSALRRRFGQLIIKRLDQALGFEQEFIQPILPVEPFIERIACLEPIITRTGIEIALAQILETLCLRLRQEAKGLRTAVFKCFRVDGKLIPIEIGTNRLTHNNKHLFKLFENKLDGIEPAMGIEVFTLEAKKTEDILPEQEKLWATSGGLDETALSELLDRLESKLGKNKIHRYLPDEHHWPERSMKPASSLKEELTTKWKNDRPRPLQLLFKPELITVTAPIPDYPPMLFRYKGKLHKIIKADGPERIEQEWWLHQGEHRDYYCVEDEEGHRYWLFRSGHYMGDKRNHWFLHGFFA